MNHHSDCACMISDKETSELGDTCAVRRPNRQIAQMTTQSTKKASATSVLNQPGWSVQAEPLRAIERLTS